MGATIKRGRNRMALAALWLVALPFPVGAQTTSHPVAPKRPVDRPVRAPGTVRHGPHHTVASDTPQEDAGIRGARKRIHRMARVIWPDGVLPPERAPWFCDLMTRLCVTNPSLVYFDVRASVDGGVVSLRGATNVASMTDLLSRALKVVGVTDVRSDVRVLPDAVRVGDRAFGVCVAPRALTWQQPYVTGRGQPPGVQTELLFGEPVLVLDQRDGCLLVQSGDGYWGWVTGDAIQRTTQAVFTEYLSIASRGVLTRDVTAGDFRIPRGAVVRVADVDKDTVSIALAGRASPEIARDAVRLVDHDGAVIRKRVRALAAWTKTPYVFGGRSVVGTDCSGLISTVWQQTGQPLGRDAWQQAFAGRLVGTHGYRSAIQPGDQLFFIDGSGKIYHTGVAVDATTVLHAAPPAVRVSSLDPEAPRYERRLDRDLFMVKRY